MATSLVPSADEATELQYSLGALVGSQVAPPFVEIAIKPGAPRDQSLATATHFIPSADAAAPVHLIDELDGAQVAPEFVEM